MHQTKLTTYLARFTVCVITLSLSFGLSQNKDIALAGVGTHLGEGDIGTQVNIMDSVIGQQNGDFPVTIMVDMGVSLDDLNKLAATAKNNKLVPIVRINFVCTATTNESAEMVNNVKTAFGKDVIIAFGNEVNNQSSDRAGCTDWSKYATNYNAIKNLGSISPSALDWYMGDDRYKADLFLSKSGLSSAYANAPIRTANAYGCIGQTAKSCEPTSTDTQNIGTNGTTGKQLYLTEFSLSPGGEDPPDKNLKNVLQFIKEKADDMEAVHITPLVRNVCSDLQSEGEWLIYVNGQLFTSHGTKVDPECVPITKSPLAAYDPRDPNNYYTYPLNFRHDQGLNNKKNNRDVLIYNMVKDQGYQVFCPADPVKITKEVGDRAYEYFEHYPSSTVELGGGMGQVAVLDAARIALLRGNEKETDTKKTSSLEGFFGANNLEDKQVETGQGSAMALMTLEQQCQKKFNKVLSVQEMCGPSASGGLCPANSMIPGTNINHWEMLGRMEPLIHKTPSVTCEDWARPWNDALLPTIDEETFEETKEALLNMPLNFDTVYRMAYLVISPPQNIDEGNIDHNCGDGGDTFWFMEKHINADGCAGPDHFSAKKHAPIFIAFKIPDFATNRSASLGYEDGAQITADALRTLEHNEWIKNDEIGRRGSILNDVAREQDIRLTGEKEAQQSLVINCSGTPNCTEEDYPGDFPIYLREALVDIINGYGSTCQDSHPSERMENAGEIFSLTGVDDLEPRGFTAPLDSGVGKNSATRSWDWGIKLRGKSDIGKSSPNWLNENDTNPRVHIVAPIGSNLESITASLDTLFSLENLETMKETNCLVDAGGKCGVTPEVYPITGASFGFSESEGEKEFYNPEKDCPVDEETGLQTIPCNNDSFTATVKDANNSKALYFPGAKLGWMVRKVQESVRGLNTKAGQYIHSCERTEDLFTGRCSGAPYTGDESESITGGEYPGMSAECKPITDPSKSDNPCYVNNLIPYFEKAGNSPEEAKLAALKASAICYRESRGSATALNNGCTTGKSVDYSVGLFQINLIISSRCPGGITSYTWNPPSCVVEDQSRLDECTKNLQIPENNIEWMVKASGGGTNWGPWKTNASGVCRIE